MTLNQFMLAYKENRRDIFVVHSNDEEELNRFGSAEYFLDFDCAYGDCTISEFWIDVVDNYCLVFFICLDIPNPNSEE